MAEMEHGALAVLSLALVAPAGLFAAPLLLAASAFGAKWKPRQRVRNKQERGGARGAEVRRDPLAMCGCRCPHQMLSTCSPQLECNQPKKLGVTIGRSEWALAFKLRFPSSKILNQGFNLRLGFKLKVSSLG